jgi:prophage DNA circulation protein
METVIERRRKPMARYPHRLMVFTILSLAALLLVGVGTASAHGGKRNGGTNVSALVTQAAKELDVTRAALKTAIVDSANTHIDDALADEDIDSDQADELKAEVEDNLGVAYAVSQTRTVASNLKITTAQLNTAFRAARKALATAKIDKALANGDITADEAADLKTQVDSVKFTGYKGGVFGGFNSFAYGGGGGCGGRGDAAGSDDSGSSSSSNSVAFRDSRR